MYAVINRLRDSTEKQSLGYWHFYEGLNLLMTVCTLELPDKQNQNNISRIPSKKYLVKKRWSEKFKWHFHVTDVEGRDWILVHSGNYFKQIRGCILVGTSFKDINKDGELDVRWSRNMLNKMLAIAPDEFDLFINDNDI